MLFAKLRQRTQSGLRQRLYIYSISMSQAAAFDSYLGMCAGEARYWARPWRLAARAVHTWRAHREGMRAAAAAESEDVVVTAGRATPSAGRDSDVLRVWHLSDTSAGEGLAH